MGALFLTGREGRAHKQYVSVESSNWISTRDWWEYGRIENYMQLQGELDYKTSVSKERDRELEISSSSFPQLPYQTGNTVGFDESIGLFRRGYLDAGGDSYYLDHIIYDVIGSCEYGWEPYYPKNYYLSRAQFESYSWYKSGGGDPADDYQVGGNVARWIDLIGIDAAGTTSGWPVCWHVGNW